MDLDILTVSEEELESVFDCWEESLGEWQELLPVPLVDYNLCSNDLETNYELPEISTPSTKKQQDEAERTFMGEKENSTVSVGECSGISFRRGKRAVGFAAKESETSDSSSVYDPRWKCDGCTMKFKYKSQLNQHKVSHTDETPYKCPEFECQMAFKSTGSLNRHLKSHKNVREFECDVCDKAYMHKSNLKKHKMTHHSETIHKCGKCVKTFIEKEKLVYHNVTHHALFE